MVHRRDELQDIAADGGAHLLAAHIDAEEANLGAHLPGGQLADEKVYLVLGSEGQGLSTQAMQVCKLLAKDPAPKK